MVRQRPGAPEYGEARSLEFPNDHVVVTSPVVQFPTSRMITEEQYVKRINYLGSPPCPPSCLPQASTTSCTSQRSFGRGSESQNDRVQQTIKLFESAGVPSPSAKKGVVFGVIPREDLKRVLPRLAPHFKLNGDPPPVIRDPSSGLTVIISEISTRGAC